MVEINDEWRGAYNYIDNDNIDDNNNNIKFKTWTIRSSLCNYSGTSLDNDYNIIAIPTDNNSNSFKFKQQTSEKSGNGEKNRCWNNGSIKISK